MKKLLTMLISLALCICVALGLSACKSDEQKKYSVYAPDGAPALSVVSLCESSERYDVKVVAATSIQAYVTGENAKADFAVMPVNAAVKLLGSGEKYKLLGTVTHGNLFLLKKTGGAEITADNVQTLIGKTVGVINLDNVPGLTFKVVLADKGIEYNELKDGVLRAEDKVNLKNVAATEVLPSNSDCDYFVVPEPAATTKINATGGKLSLAASLQNLYGGNGYPQAVAVAKSSICDSDADAVSAFISSFADSEAMLTGSALSAERVVGAVQSKMPADMSPTFTAANLNSAVIANCSIKFVSAANCKESVKSFITKLNGVSAASWGTPSDVFFYE